jgi:hypothetical protein
LAANADFKVVYNQKDRKIENYSWGRSELEALKCELYQCFTKIETLTDADYNVRLYLKTEQFNSFYPDVDLKIYTEQGTADSPGHGIGGLFVALPGKASLIFELARELSKIIPQN